MFGVAIFIILIAILIIVFKPPTFIFDPLSMSRIDHHRLGDVIFTRDIPLLYSDGMKIFVKTDDVRYFFDNSILDKPYHLITGNSDYSPSMFFSNEELRELLDNEHLLSWESENWITEHPKVKYLPIGLKPDDKIIKFCKDNSKSLKNVPKEDKVYYNFRDQWNTEERTSYPFKHDSRVDLGFEEYMNEMAKHKYVMAPMGNGIDTHRFWEAQVCGCIPIIRVPKEFLPTYDGYPYICLEGECHVSLGDYPNGKKIKMLSIDKKCC